MDKIRPIKCEVCKNNRAKYGSKTEIGKPKVLCNKLEAFVFELTKDIAVGQRLRQSRKAKINQKIKDYIDTCSLFSRKWYTLFIKIRDKV